MKKKNGFTIMELMGVIVLVGLISTMAGISINAISKKTKCKAYNTKAVAIEAAAVMWAQDTKLNGDIEKTVSNLVSNGYLKNEGTGNDCFVADPRNKEESICDYKVSIEKNNLDYYATLKDSNPERCGD